MTANERAGDAGAKALPFDLTISVNPLNGPVDEQTTLVARLTNPTAAIQLVNRRLLVNRRGADGEVWLDLEGPAGYQNTHGYRVRAGRAAAEFFVPLGPGETLEATWTLNDYQSLHIPGEYRLSVTYHNEIARTPDGRPVAVGEVTASLRFDRHR